jgi:fatty acid desaturase
MSVVSTLPRTALDQLDDVAHQIVAELHTASRGVFWADLLVSAFVGWGAFGVALMTRPWSATMFGAAIVSAFALYRCLCFIHEITHLRRNAVPGFETAWNLLIGVPLLLPTFAYVGVHQSHHNLSTYGTKDDPEYLPFATSRAMIVIFAVQSSLLIPPLLFLRLVILAPLGLLWPSFHRWLESHASSFSMNPAYRRVVSPAMSVTMRRWEATVFVVWAAILAAMYAGVIPIRALALWAGVFVLVSFVNTLRVLGAHEYESDGTMRDRQGQLTDSIDTPGGLWTALWAPVGLRYHALHHYFPGIPYHNLGKAYRRIVAASVGSTYREFSSPSLRHSLTSLYSKARTAASRARAALLNADTVRRSH